MGIFKSIKIFIAFATILTYSGCYDLTGKEDKSSTASSNAYSAVNTELNTTKITVTTNMEDVNNSNIKVNNEGNVSGLSIINGNSNTTITVENTYYTETKAVYSKSISSVRTARSVGEKTLYNKGYKYE